MLLTEKEARDKWCPFALARVYNASVNRARPEDAGLVDPYCNCVASRCMAWRFKEEYARTEVPASLDEYMTITHNPPPGAGWIDTNEPNRDNATGMGLRWWRRQTHGYCAKIGEPKA